MRNPKGSAPPSAWRRQPLAAQLSISVIAASALVFAGFFFYDLRHSRTRLDALERATMAATLPLVQSIIEEAMVAGERRHIDALFSSLRRGGSGNEAFLLDHAKRVVDTGDIAGGRTPRRWAQSQADPGRFLTLDFELANKPSCVRCHGAQPRNLGYIRVVSPRIHSRQELAKQVYLRLAPAAVGFLILGLITLAAIRRMVHAPMHRLLEAMDRVGRGNLDTRIGVPLSGEFQAIAERFNAMLDQLQRDHSRIDDLHRRQVAQMDRLVSLGELAAQLAHEVRNPLTGLTSALQVLRDGCPRDNPRHEIMNKMLAQLTRMDQTMGSFLAYARMPEAAARPFQLHEPLSRCLFLIEPRLKQQKIEFERKVAERLPTLVGDPGQIEQVLLNLLLNAAQAMPDGGRLTVSAQTSRDDVLIEVADTGPGIAPENLDAVFRPFFTTKENGSGLGLPIARQIATAHGGSLWLESVLGRGTSVFMRLPAARRTAGEDT